MPTSNAFVPIGFFTAVTINHRNRKEQQEWAIMHKNHQILYENSYYQNQAAVI